MFHGDTTMCFVPNQKQELIPCSSVGQIPNQTLLVSRVDTKPYPVCQSGRYTKPSPARQSGRYQTIPCSLVGQIPNKRSAVSLLPNQTVSCQFNTKPNGLLQGLIPNQTANCQFNAKPYGQRQFNTKPNCQLLVKYKAIS